MVALESPWRFCFVEYARARSDELLVKLPLMIAPVPTLAIQRL